METRKQPHLSWQGYEDTADITKALLTLQSPAQAGGAGGVPSLLKVIGQTKTKKRPRRGEQSCKAVKCITGPTGVFGLRELVFPHPVQRHLWPQGGTPGGILSFC